MKTATVFGRTPSMPSFDSFSSLYVGMKTATDVYFWIMPRRVSFQFPIRWDEDCNSRKTLSTPLSGFFQFPIRWDEDCNSTSPSCCIKNIINFQFPIRWDEDCNICLVVLVLACKPLSVPYTLG